MMLLFSHIRAYFAKCSCALCPYLMHSEMIRKTHVFSLKIRVYVVRLSSTFCKLLFRKVRSLLMRSSIVLCKNKCTSILQNARACCACICCVLQDFAKKCTCISCAYLLYFTMFHKMLVYFGCVPASLCASVCFIKLMYCAQSICFCVRLPGALYYILQKYAGASCANLLHYATFC